MKRDVNQTLRLKRKETKQD